jgi:hypothetical protein
MSNLRAKLIQWIFLAVAVLTVFFVLSNSSHQSGGPGSATHTLTVGISIIAACIGLAAIGLFFMRQNKMQNTTVQKRYGLLILGIIVLVIAVLSLFQGHIIGG